MQKHLRNKKIAKKCIKQNIFLTEVLNPPENSKGLHCELSGWRNHDNSSSVPNFKPFF